MNEVVFTCEEHTDKEKVGKWIKVNPSFEVKCDKCPADQPSQAKWVFVEVADVVCPV